MAFYQAGLPLQISESLYVWSMAVNGKHSVDIAYIYIIKAFDVVCHIKLLRKLEALSIEGSRLNWVACLFSNRSQHDLLLALSFPTAENSLVVSYKVASSGHFHLVFVLTISFIYLAVSALRVDDVKLYFTIDSRADREML